MSEELKPCPFCGHNDNLIIYHAHGTILHPWCRVKCDECGAEGPDSDKGDHVEMWNTRR